MYRPSGETAGAQLSGLPLGVNSFSPEPSLFTIQILLNPEFKPAWLKTIRPSGVQFRPHNPSLLSDPPVICRNFVRSPPGDAHILSVSSMRTPTRALESAVRLRSW